MTLSTCKTCPLFVKPEPNASIGHCHAQPVTIPIPQPVNQVLTNGHGGGQQMLVIFHGGWALLGEDSPGCRHHPEIAARLAEAQSEAASRLARHQSTKGTKLLP